MLPDSEKRDQDEVVSFDDSFFWRPHTITALVVFVFSIAYFALFEVSVGNFLQICNNCFTIEFSPKYLQVSKLSTSLKVNLFSLEFKMGRASIVLRCREHHSFFQTLIHSLICLSWSKFKHFFTHSFHCQISSHIWEAHKNHSLSSIHTISTPANNSLSFKVSARRYL